MRLNFLIKRRGVDLRLGNGWIVSYLLINNLCQSLKLWQRCFIKELISSSILENYIQKLNLYFYRRKKCF